MNLLHETIECLLQNGWKTIDVEYVILDDTYFSWQEFERLADVHYDNDYGKNEVQSSLKIVGKYFWLERAEYDGSEWWEYKAMPNKPSEHKVPKTLLTGV